MDNVTPKDVVVVIDGMDDEEWQIVADNFEEDGVTSSHGLDGEDELVSSSDSEPSSDSDESSNFEDSDTDDDVPGPSWATGTGKRQRLDTGTQDPGRSGTRGRGRGGGRGKGGGRGRGQRTGGQADLRLTFSWARSTAGLPRNNIPFLGVHGIKRSLQNIVASALNCILLFLMDSNLQFIVDMTNLNEVARLG